MRTLSNISLGFLRWQGLFPISDWHDRHVWVICRDLQAHSWRSTSWMLVMTTGTRYAFMSGYICWKISLQHNGLFCDWSTHDNYDKGFRSQGPIDQFSSTREEAVSQLAAVWKPFMGCADYNHRTIVELKLDFLKKGWVRNWRTGFSCLKFEIFLESFIPHWWCFTAIINPDNN